MHTSVHEEAHLVGSYSLLPFVEGGAEFGIQVPIEGQNTRVLLRGKLERWMCTHMGRKGARARGKGNKGELRGRAK